MSESGYKVDDEGNLVEPEREAPVSPEQGRTIVRVLILSESLVVLLLLGAALYFEDMRGVLLVAAAVYAVVAVFMTRFMRRSLEKRVDRGQLG